MYRSDDLLNNTHNRRGDDDELGSHFNVVTQYETIHRGNFHRKCYFQIPLKAGHHRPAKRHLNALC